ncbi:MAG: SCO family protein [Gemmataceae bacterium]|nr:SCO family protein [Gemmataceae bacterium]MDW8243109.1 SCO family protein [Thermogemmata sp.]
MLRGFFGLLVILMVAALLAVALAQPRVEAGIDEQIGAQVPIDLPLRDENDQATTLRECMGGKPTILVPMYYRCPMNCNLILRGLVETLREMPQNFSVGRQFHVVCLSFDHREHGDLARAKKEVTLQEYGRAGAEHGWRFLTGSKEAIAQTLSAIGYRFEFDKAYKEYNHPSAIILLSPQGVTTRYFYGFKYDGEIPVQGDMIEMPDGTRRVPTTTLRLSILEAAEGKGGSVLDRLILLCYRFDHLNKGYSLNVLRVVQFGGLLTLGLLIVGVGAALWQEHRRSRNLGVSLATSLPSPLSGSVPVPPASPDARPSGGAT